MQIVPWGFRGMLNWIKDYYDNPPVLITENGMSSNSGLEDNDRIQYYHVIYMNFYIIYNLTVITFRLKFIYKIR